jgi:transcriptional regulator with XRE-family HTH domain
MSTLRFIKAHDWRYFLPGDCNMNEVNTLSKRIRQVREKYNLTQTDFGRQLGSSKSSIINYETGKRIPGALFLINIIKNFNINPGWLMLGKGDMVITGIKNGSSREMDENIVRMMEHLQIPAMRLALMAEYNRLQVIFKPIIDEFDECREKIKNKEFTR